MSDYFRRHRKQPEILSFEGIPDAFFCLPSTPDREAEANEIYELLKQLIANSLDLKQRAIIELFYQEDLTQQEISNQLKLHQASLIIRRKSTCEGHYQHTWQEGKVARWQLPFSRLAVLPFSHLAVLPPHPLTISLPRKSDN